MKTNTKDKRVRLTVFVLFALTAFGSQAASVTSTFNTGDTLTATQMNEIKDAVNDNDLSKLFGGDGSAGDLTVIGSVSWQIDPPTNPNFADITIDVGQTLEVPAGTTLRCSGSFRNDGTLRILPGTSNRSSRFLNTLPVTQAHQAVAHPGDSLGAAVPGQYTTDATVDPTNLNGGPGGIGIPQARVVTSPGLLRIGGGAGAGWFGSNAGGGLVRIQCSGAIANNGAIEADGDSAAADTDGGGGGGIVILASRTSIDNSFGTISATGGDGGQSDFWGSGGGGGGGGIVAFIAPAVLAGTVDVGGGLGGISAGNVTAPGRTGGNGGGASGGDGGAGGNVSSGAVVPGLAGGAGQAGYVVTVQTDAALLLR